jgi:hypothetical protein
MRLQVKDINGNKIYVTASMWPRSRSNNIGCPINQLETIPQDYDEAEQYVRAHPGCGTFDVELECHFGQKQASAIMSRLVEEKRIMIDGKGRSQRFHI